VQANMRAEREACRDDEVEEEEDSVEKSEKVGVVQSENEESAKSEDEEEIVKSELVEESGESEPEQTT
jgi:hypothetical protein